MKRALVILSLSVFTNCWAGHPVTGLLGALGGTGAGGSGTGDLLTLTALIGGAGAGGSASASPGFTASTTNLIVSESGSSASFDLRLNAAPNGLVVVDVAMSDYTEATCGAGSLVFTTSNWSEAQTVTVTGVDDTTADGNQNVTVLLTLGSSTSDTSGYADLDPDDVIVVNSDDDQPGVTVSPTSVNVSETATVDSFSVVLNTEPDNNVVVDIANPDTGEASISAASLTFTVADWDTPQSVNVTGVDDALSDGAQVFSLALTINGGSTFDTTGYAGLDPDDVTVTNSDDDSPGFTVVGGPVTSVEGGTAQNFTIRPNTQPAGANIVSVSLVSNDTTEATVSPSTITWNNGDWTTAKSVTVTPVDDSLTDGAQAFTVDFSPAASTAAGYAGLPTQSVNVTNNDNDSPGFMTTGTPVSTTEGGSGVSFMIRPATEPSGANIVSITVSSNDTSEGTVSATPVTWSSADWTTYKSVTVTPVDDSLTDGAVGYTLTINPAASSEAAYAGMGTSTVNVTNNDDDSAGFIYTSTPVSTAEGGGAVTFTVRPQTQPAVGNNVSLSISSSDTSEVTVSPSNVSWSNATWSSATTITVTPVDDSLTDGAVAYTINLNPSGSTESSYSGLGTQTVNGTHADNDTAGFSMTGVPVTTAEGGGSVTFNIRPDTEPSGGNTIVANFVSNDTSEGTVTSSVSWTSADWTTYKPVTVTPVQDAVADGAIGYTISVSGGGTESSYGSVNTSVNVTNNDDDAVGYNISAISGGTTESGGTATFTVSLTSEPTGTVNIGLSSSNTAEGTVGTSVSFNAGDWSSAKTVTVTGVDDGAVDGNVTYSIITAIPTGSDTSGYLSSNPADVSVVNWDDETRRIFATTNQWIGGSIGGTAGADSKCTTEAASRGYPGTWKALIAQPNASYPPLRRACTTSNCTTDEGIDWVLYANLTYYRADDDALIGTTNSGRIFIFPLTNAFATSLPRTWTSFYADWVGGATNFNCNGWTDTSAGLFGGISDPNVTSSSSIYGGGYSCQSGTARLICAEQ